jgi:putative glutamine amidotransferase
MSRGLALHYTEDATVAALRRAGARVLLIPVAGGAEAAEDFAELLDGLYMPGGEDVSPSFYGEKPLRPEWRGEARRVRFELACIEAFRRLGKPVLGVCRGAQVLNVAFGGSLYQDLPTQLGTKVKHRDSEKPHTNFHPVRMAPGSLLRRVTGKGHLSRAASKHHQGIRRLGKGLRASAWSPDGLVEGVEHPGDRFTLGVQFHCEWVPRDAAQRALFAAFVKACAGD